MHLDNLTMKKASRYIQAGVSIKEVAHYMGMATSDVAHLKRSIVQRGGHIHTNRRKSFESRGIAWS